MSDQKKMEIGDFTGEDLKYAERYETLGPGYFAARRCAEHVMSGAEVETLQKVALKVTDEVCDAVYDYVETFLLSDLEHNLQHHIDRGVQGTVRALLTGQEWALRQYPLANNYEAADIRKAIVEHAGESVLKARVADLEKENARLTEALKWERENRSMY